MIGGKRCILPLVFLVLCAANANSSGILWTLSGVEFTDGGSGSGSFVYNGDTGLYSSIDIITTEGTAFGGATYSFLDTGATFLSSIQLDAVTSGGGTSHRNSGCSS
jgi:hypothetical protein